MLIKMASLISVFFSLAAFAADNSYGIFMVVKGDVQIQSSQNSAVAKIGGKINPGETIKTGPDSRAKIVMSDKNVFNVSPDSVLKIEKYENDIATGKKSVAMNLEQGKVRANVEQKYDGDKSTFMIKTPTAVAGVRGTQFMTSYDPQTKTTEIITFKGTVSFSSVNSKGQPTGPAVMVGKGQTTSVAPGAPPAPPQAMPKSDLNKADSESTASNMKKDSDSKQASAAASASGSKSADSQKQSDSQSQQASATPAAATAAPKAAAPVAVDSGTGNSASASSSNNASTTSSSSTAASSTSSANSAAPAASTAPAAGSAPASMNAPAASASVDPAATAAPAPVAAAPAPTKMISTSDLTAAPDFRAPASVDVSAAPSSSSTSSSSATAAAPAAATPPPPPMPTVPAAAMLPPPPNPLLNTIISNKVQNVNLSITPKPQ